MLAALDDLGDALARNVEIGNQVLGRIDRIRAQRESGQSWSDMVATGERPLIVELLSANIERLSSSGSRLRRAQARALYDEGMTMEQIASYYGVTRQRVSALLKDRPARD